MVDLPALKRAVIIETSELVLVAGKEDREAMPRLGSAMYVFRASFASLALMPSGAIA